VAASEARVKVPPPASTVPVETVVNFTDPVQEAAVPLDKLDARLMRFTSIPSEEAAKPISGNVYGEVLMLVVPCAHADAATTAARARRA
jgi:hypothetical protein